MKPTTKKTTEMRGDRGGNYWATKTVTTRRRGGQDSSGGISSICEGERGGRRVDQRRDIIGGGKGARAEYQGV